MTDFPLTFKCNNNCISCILRYEIVKKFSDPTLNHIKDIIHKIDPNTDYIGFTGGEPTLRKQFFEILQYARKIHPNLYIFILTNGRMFSYKKFTNRFADLKLGNYMVAVTIYGHTKRVHESITKSKGSFDQVVEGIKNLLSFGIPTEIRVVINKMNYCFMDKIADFIINEFPSPDRVVFTNLKITGNAYKNMDKVLVKYTEL